MAYKMDCPSLYKKKAGQVETKTKIISFYENPKYKNLMKTSLLFESVNHPISKS